MGSRMRLDIEGRRTEEANVGFLWAVVLGPREDRVQSAHKLGAVVAVRPACGHETFWTPLTN